MFHSYPDLSSVFSVVDCRAKELSVVAGIAPLSWMRRWPDEMTIPRTPRQLQQAFQKSMKIWNRCFLGCQSFRLRSSKIILSIVFEQPCDLRSRAYDFFKLRSVCHGVLCCTFWVDFKLRFPKYVTKNRSNVLRKVLFKFLIDADHEVHTHLHDTYVLNLHMIWGPVFFVWRVFQKKRRGNYIKYS